jgi:P27 family predicted phage terminase small subunit
MRGRKPTPSRLHELNGDPGKRHRSRDGEPRPEALEKIPRPPAHLNRRAAGVWRRTVPELIRMRLIAGIDSASLAAYCSAVATYQEADERLKTEKWTTSTARGGSRPNPLFKIRDDALRLVQKFAGEFGLSPSTRARVKGASAPKQSTFDSFLDNDSDGEDAQSGKSFAANSEGVGSREARPPAERMN